MICPWLVKTITETDNKNSYNNSRRTEHQEFDKCMQGDCPYYALRHGRDDGGAYSIPACLRVEFEKQDHLPIH